MKPPLAGQTVVVIGDSSGIGLETARLAREEGADIILVARTSSATARTSRDTSSAWCWGPSERGSHQGVRRQREGDRDPERRRGDVGVAERVVDRR